MITAAEMRALEDAGEFFGVGRARLMENAGKALAGEMRKRFALNGRKIVFLCGQGNNAGDGFVAARELAKTAKVEVIFFGAEEKLPPEAKKAFSKLDKKIVFGKESLDKIRSAEFAVDALLGTGVRGKVREPIASAIREFNSCKAKKVCVDIPSGINPDTGLGKLYAKPDLIVSFHEMKKGLQKFCKKVVVAGIGIPKMGAKTIRGKDLGKFFPTRAGASHKGENGRVLVVGGSKDLVGAPALAAMAALAALRSGVDLVTVAAPEKCGFVINTYSPDIIVKKFRGDFFTERNAKQVIELSKKVDAVLMGPGIGLEKETQKFVRKIVNLIKVPLVLDADAIKAASGMRFGGSVLITPHSKEFEIFTGIKIDGKKVQDIVKGAAGKHNCTILLKGPVDVVSNGRGVALNKTGNAGMTVAGTGDVLAGICTAFAALKMNLFCAACCAAFLNGKIGDRLLKEKGYGFIASDFLELIPLETRKLRGN